MIKGKFISRFAALKIALTDAGVKILDSTEATYEADAEITLENDISVSITEDNEYFIMKGNTAFKPIKNPAIALNKILELVGIKPKCLGNWGQCPMCFVKDDTWHGESWRCPVEKECKAAEGNNND